MMDDDDLYFRTYLKSSIDLMKSKKVNLVGSPEMLFIYPKLNYHMSVIKCPAKRQIHEATMIFTKKYYSSMPGFQSNSQGEGAKMVDFNDNNVACTNISDCMVCVCHNNNTLSKDRFIQHKMNVSLNNSEQVEILKEILKEEENLNPMPDDYVWVDPNKKEDDSHD